MIPANLPITSNLQTINRSDISVEVCETDLAGYLHYRGYEEFRYISRSTDASSTFSCLPNTSVTKILKVTNKAWTLSNNTFDLEKDIVGHSFTSPFVLVRGSVNGKYNV